MNIGTTYTVKSKSDKIYFVRNMFLVWFENAKEQILDQADLLTYILNTLLNNQNRINEWLAQFMQIYYYVIYTQNYTKNSRINFGKIPV